MPERAHFIEILSTARAKTDLDADEKQPAVVITIRPQPGTVAPFVKLTFAAEQRAVAAAQRAPAERRRAATGESTTPRRQRVDAIGESYHRP